MFHRIILPMAEPITTLGLHRSILLLSLNLNLNLDLSLNLNLNLTSLSVYTFPSVVLHPEYVPPSLSTAAALSIRSQV